MNEGKTTTMESITVTIPAQQWNSTTYHSDTKCYLATALRGVFVDNFISIAIGYNKEGKFIGSLYGGDYSRVFIRSIGEYITSEPFNNKTVKSAFDAGKEIKVTLKKL